jgi:predicted Zn-dependent protease
MNYELPAIPRNTYARPVIFGSDNFLWLIVCLSVYMRSLSLFYLAFLGFAGTCNLAVDNAPDKTSHKVEYSFSCLDTAVAGNATSNAISNATSIIRNLAIKQKEITDSVQNEWGEAFHKDAIESETFVLVNDAAVHTQLQKVLTDLLAARENPSHIQYSIYLLKDSAINAFTFGGHIYLTKAMFDQCKDNTDLLYSIIGHEIGHSEKGHIKKTIQEMMITDNIFGEDKGASAFQILKALTGSFNQKNELEADYYGIDLAYDLGKDVCATVIFWNKMAKSENQYSKFEDLLRTHPFSSLRARCLQNHILNNFNRNCSASEK